MSAVLVIVLGCDYCGQSRLESGSAIYEMAGREAAARGWRLIDGDWMCQECIEAERTDPLEQDAPPLGDA